MTLPNILTCLRVVLIPVFMALAYQGTAPCDFAALVVYVAACLTDYIDGDTYFRTAYPEHNLVRSRTQMKLAQRMDEEFETMKKIIRTILEEK